MSIKVIAIGNRFMGDDSVAVCVAEYLREELENKSIEVIIGETDFEYCLSKIHEGDFLLIMDATCYGIKAGTVTFKALEFFLEGAESSCLFSQHGCNLIKMLRIYNINAKGFIIGIEGKKFDFDSTLSRSIEAIFQDLCYKIYEIICKVTLITR